MHYLSEIHQHAKYDFDVYGTDFIWKVMYMKIYFTEIFELFGIQQLWSPKYIEIENKTPKIVFLKIAVANKDSW